LKKFKLDTPKLAQSKPEIAIIDTAVVMYLHPAYLQLPFQVGLLHFLELDRDTVLSWEAKIAVPNISRQ